jgi:hypothetical protein
MNTYTAIDVSYLKPSRTLETILLENGNEKKVIYVYNYDGVHFRVFNYIIDILLFFDDEFEPEISFETEAELGVYLSNLNLESISNASPILR